VIAGAAARSHVNEAVAHQRAQVPSDSTASCYAQSSPLLRFAGGHAEKPLAGGRVTAGVVRSVRRSDDRSGLDSRKRCMPHIELG
jgi:hypothetical protein